MHQSRIIPNLACLAAGLFSLYDVFQLTYFNVINSALMQRFFFNHFGLGIFSASFLVANALCLPPCGFLMDKYSPRKIGIGFFSLTILATFILGLSHNLALCTIARIAQGLASATSLLLSTRIATLWFPNDKGLAIGCLLAMASSGGIMANSVGPLIFSKLGLESSLIYIAVIGCFLLIFMWHFLQDKSNIDLQLKPQSIEAPKVLSYKVICLGAYIGLMSTPLFILGALWGNTFLLHNNLLSNHQAGFVISMLFFGMLVGTPLIGKINDHLKKPYLLMSTSPLACTLLIILFTITRSSSNLYLSSLTFLLGLIGSCQCLAFVSLASEYPVNKRSAAIGIAAFSENIIGAVSQTLYGKITDLTTHLLPGYFINHQYRAGMIIFPIAFLACSFLILSITTLSQKMIFPGIANYDS